MQFLLRVSNCYRSISCMGNSLAADRGKRKTHSAQGTAVTRSPWLDACFTAYQRRYSNNMSSETDGTLAGVTQRSRCCWSVSLWLICLCLYRLIWAGFNTLSLWTACYEVLWPFHAPLHSSSRVVSDDMSSGIKAHVRHDSPLIRGESF